MGHYIGSAPPGDAARGAEDTDLLAAESRMEREKALALYDKLLATNPDVQRKGDTMPYTSLNGNMFSLFTKENRLTLRLPAGERESFLARYKTTLSEQYGHVQPEYVVVPDSLLAKTAELKRYFDISYTYVSSLRPKATTKKKPAAAKQRRKK